jgi:hypothetical protein
MRVVYDKSRLKCTGRILCCGVLLLIEITFGSTKMIKLEDLEKLVKTSQFLAEIKGAFFEGMNVGYVADKPKKNTITELPGSKMVLYVSGPWKLTDVYHVTPLSSMSGGTIVIAYEDVPVWMMQYFGQYYEEAIPCLKAALRQAYSNCHFIGGRGPHHFVFKEYIYKNSEDIFPQDFKLFRGEEKVHDKSGIIFGRHLYHGGLMC